MAIIKAIVKSVLLALWNKSSSSVISVVYDSLALDSLPLGCSNRIRSETMAPTIVKLCSTKNGINKLGFFCEKKTTTLTNILLFWKNKQTKEQSIQID